MQNIDMYKHIVHFQNETINIELSIDRISDPLTCISFVVIIINKQIRDERLCFMVYLLHEIQNIKIQLENIMQQIIIININKCWDNSSKNFRETID